MEDSSTVVNDKSRTELIAYINKLNDREISKKEASGLTYWALISALILIGYQIIDKSPKVFTLDVSVTLLPLLATFSNLTYSVYLFASWIISKSIRQEKRFVTDLSRQSMFAFTASIWFFGALAIINNIYIGYTFSQQSLTMLGAFGMLVFCIVLKVPISIIPFRYVYGTLDILFGLLMISSFLSNHSLFLAKTSMNEWLLSGIEVIFVTLVISATSIQSLLKIYKTDKVEVRKIVRKLLIQLIIVLVTFTILKPYRNLLDSAVKINYVFAGMFIIELLSVLAKVWPSKKPKLYRGFMSFTTMLKGTSLLHVAVILFVSTLAYILLSSVQSTLLSNIDISKMALEIIGFCLVSIYLFYTVGKASESDWLTSLERAIVINNLPAEEIRNSFIKEFYGPTVRQWLDVFQQENEQEFHQFKEKIKCYLERAQSMQPSTNEGKPCEIQPFFDQIKAEVHQFIDIRGARQTELLEVIKHTYTDDDDDNIVYDYFVEHWERQFKEIRDDIYSLLSEFESLCESISCQNYTTPCKKQC